MNFIGRTTLLSTSLLLLALPSLVTAQDEPPELTGTVAFNVTSKSGRLERLAVTIGDGGTGPYKAILWGEPSLPTHAIYRPRDLGPFGPQNLLPIVAFGNGGCRNTSGEFRNMLSELASQGFLVVAIGPAGNAVVMGSEDRQNMTVATQLLDGVTWAIAENSREGSAYYHKLDVTKIAVTGQSCGAQQAIQVSDDPRVTTTVAFGQGINIGPPPAGRGPNAAGPGRAGRGRGGPVATDQRYAPFAPVLVRAPADPNAPAPAPPAQNRGVEILAKIHAPILFITGGDTDTGHRSATMDFEAIDQVPEVHAWQAVGHYPATYREPNGGAFAQTAGAWLKWQLKGDKKASMMFVGKSCGLCTDPKWTIEKKHIDQ
jgi:dienelactone hydrolase